MPKKGANLGAYSVDVRCDADPEVLGLKIKAMGCRGGGCAASQRQLEHGRFAAHGCALAGVGSLEKVRHVIVVKPRETGVPRMTYTRLHSERTYCS
jgi:hypothetical protein